ncbi:hypothetical protein AMECASPLE_027381 [Ameca splendens]|uniref:Uncharacterized protein n=1 Tax=Ameca splendens TaxID=208324 RepID=A0ABV0Z3G9_9TELE
MPNHPRTHGAEPTKRPVPNAWHRTAATTRQAGQQNTSHTNTEAANKKHLSQNVRPTQIQAPGQHRHMHTPQTNELRPPGLARQSSRPRDAPPCQGKDASPASRKATARTAKRPHLPQRRRTTIIHASQAKMTEPS